MSSPDLTRRAIALSSFALSTLALPKPLRAAGCGDTVELAPEAAGTPLAGRSVAFMARELGAGRCVHVDRAAADRRHAPWSSFKIPNLLIALETGVAASLEHPIAWDAQRRPRASHWPDDWARAQTLGSAFQRSSAWAFQDLALQIGTPRYRDWLARWRYGNQRIADGDDAFWLGGSLQISPREQVEFVSRLLSGEAGVSAASLQALETVALLDERDGHRLVAKTGSGPRVAGDFDGAFEGWLVGWVRRPQAPPVAFALYTQGPGFSSIRRFRQEAALRLLEAAGYWPAQKVPG